MQITNTYNTQWSQKLAIDTKKVALKEAHQRHILADKGFFNKKVRTCDIEQEVQIVDSQTAMPIDISSYFANNLIGARPDTTKYFIEYDANGVTHLDEVSIRRLFKSFQLKTQTIQSDIEKIDPHAIVVPIGMHPRLTSFEWRKWLTEDTVLKKRYELMDKRTFEENPKKNINITNHATGSTFVDRASNLSAMTRCSGTQIHISEKSVEDVLKAHNVSIAISGPMIALFGNSPYVGGMRTGRASTRIEMLCQAEQLRAGLPKPIYSLYDYYEKHLTIALPPFVVLDNPASALDTSMGTLHTVSRIRVDMANGILRNEFRQIDSQSPYKSMQALLLIIGLIDGLKDTVLPSYKESQINLNNGVFGLRSYALWNREQMQMDKLCIYLVELAVEHLKLHNMGSLAKDFLEPLIEEIKYKSLERHTEQEDIVSMMNNLNKQALQ